MPTISHQFVGVARFELAQRIASVQHEALRRVAMHPPNPHLARQSRRRFEIVHAALIREAARSGEALAVVLESRTCRPTFQFARYCVRQCETSALADLLVRLHATDKDDINATAALVDQMQISLERLSLSAAARAPIEQRRRTRASRLKLHPKDWQDVLIAAAPGKLKIGLLILHLTGCRPCEIERGIGFQIGRSDQDVRLTLDVVGAKCDEYRGQPLRTFEFLREDLRPALTELISGLTRYLDRGCSSTFLLCDVTKRVSRHARKLWPSHQAPPTAYSFRYAFRAHLAMLGATRRQIARAMGHQSMASSLVYGRQVARTQTLELTMDISASIEPRERGQSLDYGDRGSGRAGSRIMAQAIGYGIDRALPL